MCFTSITMTRRLETIDFLWQLLLSRGKCLTVFTNNNDKFNDFYEFRLKQRWQLSFPCWLIIIVNQWGATFHTIEIYVTSYRILGIKGVAVFMICQLCSEIYVNILQLIIICTYLNKHKYRHVLNNCRYVPFLYNRRHLY